MPLLLVTLGDGPTQISIEAVSCSQIMVQVDGPNPVFIADDPDITAETGLVMNAGTPGGMTNISGETLLNSWFLFGTPGDRVRTMYLPSSIIPPPAAR